MSNTGGKLVPISLEKLEFENDFGQSPIGLGHLSRDQGFIAVASLVGAFVGAAIAGLPLAAVVMIAGLNDINYARRKVNNQHPPDAGESVISNDSNQTVDAEVHKSISVEENAPTNQQLTVEKIAPTNQQPLPPEQWSLDLKEYPSILIYGAQGAGKTSMATWLIGERIKGAHQIKILDPHRAYGQWEGLECIGDGMNYKAINNELKAFTDEIKARYEMRAKTPNYNPPKLTLVCDEFTSWADKCSYAAGFFREALTDIRKINLYCLFISHARTLKGLGGSDGLAAARDAGLLELELEAQVNPVTGEASPKLLGWLKYPGVGRDERRRVAIASWMNGTKEFNTVPGIRQNLENLFNGSTAQELEPLTRPSEPLNQPNGEGSTNLIDGSQFGSKPGSEQFTPLNLSKEQVQALIQSLNHELNQTQIIERLWQVRKGGSAAWKEAYTQFKAIVGE